MRLSLVESLTWFLSSNLRICNLQVGVACALGGARLDAAGCASVRLATHTCDADGLGAIRDALANGELVQGASLIPRELATPSENAPPHPMCASDHSDLLEPPSLRASLPDPDHRARDFSPGPRASSGRRHSNGAGAAVPSVRSRTHSNLSRRARRPPMTWRVPSGRRRCLPASDAAVPPLSSQRSNACPSVEAESPAAARSGSSLRRTALSGPRRTSAMSACRAPSVTRGERRRYGGTRRPRSPLLMRRCRLSCRACAAPTTCTNRPETSINAPKLRKLLINAKAEAPRNSPRCGCRSAAGRLRCARPLPRQDWATRRLE